MTELLDLPLEIFKTITHELNTESSSSTWRLRSVCRTFAAEIEDDLLGNQPRSVVENMPQIMNNRIAGYLLLHLHKTSDINNLLLKMLRRMADYLIQELAILEKDRKDTETSMIDGFVRVCGPVYVNTLIWPSPGPASIPQWSSMNMDDGAELDHWQKVVAAMALQASDLLRTLLATMPPSIWIPETTIGRGPLVMAVISNDDDLFDEVMDHLNQLGKMAQRKAVRPHDYNFDDAFSIAVNARNPRFVEQLVEFRQKLVGRVPKSTYNKWLNVAIVSLDTDIVKSVLLLCPSSDKVNSHVFTNACRIGNTDVVKMLLEEGEVDVKNNRFKSSKIPPFFRAIEFGTISTIGAVLDAGADIHERIDRSKDKDEKDTCLPIEMALERGDKAVFQFLLSRGATIPEDARIHPYILQGVVDHEGNSIDPDRYWQPFNVRS
ncbi:hypothetical protein ACET3X_004478 [Alternaria dauci]|uniref:F-box domain-containing protein n=1 Tax=Alternaria dauci TaxID=48095 RepID=A0ABR3UN19_9PLEO